MKNKLYFNIATSRSQRTIGRLGTVAITALAIILLAACSRTTGGIDNDSPAWSPDGSKIAFVSNRDGNDEIYVINSDGTNETRLSFNSKSDGKPIWSPDGSKLLCTYGGDEIDLCVMNADGSNRVDIGPIAKYLDQPWSSDSKKIVFSAYGKIYVASTEGSKIRYLTDGYSPIWSPDGNRIAFTDGVPSELFTIKADGKERVKIHTPDITDISSPVWSPDSRRIAYNGIWFPGRSSANITRGIYIVDADGSNYFKIDYLDPDNNHQDLKWSPDGSKIVFWSNGVLKDSQYRIQVADIVSRSVSGLTDGFCPVWSPDGTRIAYFTVCEDSEGNISTEIFVINADGSNDTMLTE